MNSIITFAIMFVVMVLPLSLAVGVVSLQRRHQRRSGRRSPLSEKRAYLPGEQLRMRIEDLGLEIESQVVLLLMVGPLALMVILLPRIQWSILRLSWLDWAVLGIAIIACLFSIRKILQLRHERRKYEDGARAEVYVAQQLDRLQAQDCLVLHDIPVGKFNIDHAVVGTHAVFAIETKSRRKVGKGKESANVDYDGKLLQFPGWVETDPLDQARGQSKWLAEYLRGETGEPVAVIPVVCLPGWFVRSGKDAHRSDVRVINPKMTLSLLDTGGRPVLPNAQRIRIVTALYKLYPEQHADN
ncbi:MAG: NERD domain-containing protein [Proteobacteria bacterium]|nr:NERD domain-containing protein [Pseudomonadota bacterium]